MTDSSPIPSGALLAYRFTVVESLGAGGGGHTYRVRDEVMGDEVAMKIAGSSDVEVAEALGQEFTTLAELHHPRLLEVRDLGVARMPDGRWAPYYTSALVRGQTLRLYASSRRWEDIEAPLVDALAALRFLHAAGARHGDFKEDNVLVGETGRGVLIDLGCTRPLARDAGSSAPIPSIAGTPDYLAPEILRGGDVDLRADLFALGVTLEKLSHVLVGGLPDAVTRLARRLTKTKASDRPGDVAEVLGLLGVPDAEVPDAAPRPPRLLGRSREIGVLDAMIAAVTAGQDGPRVLELVGPSGSGKTRLLRTLRNRAQPRIAVAEGHSGSSDAVRSILSRALGVELIRGGIESVLDAQRRLGADAPIALVMDDVERLAAADRAALDALVRSTEPSSPYLLILAASAELGHSNPTVHLARVSALPESDVAIWVKPWLSDSGARMAAAVTGGMPSALEQLARDLASGRCREADLPSWKADSAATDDATWRAVGPSEREAMGSLAVHDAPAEESDLTAMQVALETVTLLLGRGWIVREGPHLRLTANGVAAVSPRLTPAWRRRLSRRWLATQGRRGAHDNRAEADRVLHALGAAQLDTARGAFHRARGAIERDPAPWIRVANAIARDIGPADLALFETEIWLAAGQPDRALSAAVRSLRGRPAAQERARARRLVASALLRLGAFARAVRFADRALQTAVDPLDRARAVDVRSRALIRLGRYADARIGAEIVLAECPISPVSADLHDDIGVAASYLGESEIARSHLEAAAELHSSSENASGQARSYAYLALDAFRRGDTAKAAEGYRRAWETAERHGLSDAIATGALNLGSVSHQRGDWGKALVCYERGLRSAVALGKVGTEATLRFNVAKLYLDLGASERAEASCRRAEEQASDASMGMLIGACHSLMAEAAATRGDFGEARTWSEQARTRLLAEGATREVLEVDLERAAIELTAGEIDEAGRRLTSIAAAVEHCDALDVRATHRLLQARQWLNRGEPDHASEPVSSAVDGLLDEADALASQSGRSPLIAEIEGVRGELAAKRGSTFSAERHRARARELWEKVASTLPFSSREPFWSHPRRRALVESSARKGDSGREERLLRLLAINRRLTATLDTAAVLEATMDAAIELTRAERGFVILRSGEGLSVSVARNLDRERIGKSHLKFSRSIAERVLATGDPVVTTDAQADERFRTNASVHAMRLSSVACVPIRAPEGVLGALYLDNRFLRARFRDDDVELLMAFADQVAIALRNAQLHAALAERTKELESERARVVGLLREREEEIDRLHEQARAHTRQPESRFDYSAIIGRGPAMQKVLAVLDRVVDENLSVSIEGESGTGKELIARAIHDNGARRHGPFVSVNCGALPETLLESELFGHVRGAFTGASNDREGLFVQARGGTLFLDELGEMTAAMQVKLLRVLQEREVRPVGAGKVIPVDIRLVCATNRTLAEEVARGKFRQDLYYRVAVVEIRLPPLRERVEDISLIADHVIGRVAHEMGRKVPELSPRARRKLLTYEWPGNVRQLENVLTKAIVLTEHGKIQAGDLQLPELRPTAVVARDRRSFERVEADHIAAALRACRWNVSEVARTLGIPRPTLYRKLARHGLLEGKKAP